MYICMCRLVLATSQVQLIPIQNVLCHDEVYMIIMEVGISFCLSQRERESENVGKGTYLLL